MGWYIGAIRRAVDRGNVLLSRDLDSGSVLVDRTTLNVLMTCAEWALAQAESEAMDEGSKLVANPFPELHDEGST
jgi:hypothetical protein